MEYRNPKFNRVGTIDVEINHPTLGWIPFTANPADPETLGRVIYATLIKGDVAPYEAPPPVPEPVPVKSEVELLREELTRLKTELQTKGVIDVKVAVSPARR